MGGRACVHPVYDLPQLWTSVEIPPSLLAPFPASEGIQPGFCGDWPTPVSEMAPRADFHS